MAQKFNCCSTVLASIKSDSTFDRGFSLGETLAVTVIIGIVTAIGSWSLLSLNDPLRNSSAEVTGQFRLARARAISTTSAYRLLPTSDSTIQAQYSDTCDADPADWTNDSQLSRSLDNTVAVSTGWAVCINSRGAIELLPPEDSPIVLSEAADPTNTAEIVLFLGGSVQTQFSSNE